MDEIDFVPKDGELCKKCEFFYECPSFWFCETWKRNFWYQRDKDVRNGDSA